MLASSALTELASNILLASGNATFFSVLGFGMLGRLTRTRVVSVVSAEVRFDTSIWNRLVLCTGFGDSKFHGISNANLSGRW